MRILIVDDSMYMRTVLKNILMDAGHDVVGQAGNGKEGLEKAFALNPDLITLDNIMPDINGLEVLKTVKTRGLPSKVVMISAVGQDAMIEEARLLGADSYITKPFSPEKVIETLERI